MTPSYRHLTLGTAIATLAIAAAGCGSSSSNHTTTTQTKPKTVATKSAVHHPTHHATHHAKAKHPATSHTTTTPPPAQTVTQAQTTPPFIPFIIGEGGQDWPAVAAATALFLVPILVFTVLLRKNLLRGITFGAVRK